MYRVKTMNKISKIGLAQLDDRFEISDAFENEDAILVRSAKLHDYEFPAELKAIARAGAALREGFTPDAVLLDAEEALAALGEVSGRTLREDLVEAVFSRFCVGK